MTEARKRKKTAMLENQRTKSHKLARRVARVVERRSTAYLKLFTDLLEFETISGQKTVQGKTNFQREVDKCLRYLHEKAQQLQMDYKRYDNLVAIAELGAPSAKHGATRTPSFASSLGVAVHLDVVEPGRDWSVSPFEGKVRDGFVWGRGAQDDKGPAAAVFSALDVVHALRQSIPELQQKKSIRLLLGTREETDDWPDMDLLSRNEPTPDFVLVPDGAFPVVNAEKGLINLELTVAWPPAVVPEPPVRLIMFDGGQRGTMVPDVTRVKLEATDTQKLLADIDRARQQTLAKRPAASIAVKQAEVTDPTPRVEVELVFTGQAAHAAYPEKGHNALLDALLFLSHLPGISSNVTVLAQTLFAGCRYADGSGLDLDLIHPYMGKTTLNLGRLRIWKGGAEGELNVRFPIGLTGDNVKQKLNQHFVALKKETNPFDVEIKSAGRVQPPIYLDSEKHRDLLEPLNLAYESVTGRSGGFVSLRGTTYAKAFPLAVAFGPLDLSAGDQELAHEPDERVAVKRYLENISIYATTLLLLAYDLPVS
jgi:succinyl-diaminopimelate desuccinylase